MKNWLTVKELANYLKISEIQIYKMLGEQKIPATKIGRMWRFDQDSIDQWLKQNEKFAITERTTLHQPIEKMILSLANKLKKKWGKGFSQIILYGSWARGEQTPGSDVDLLVVLKNVSDFTSTRKELHNLSYQTCDEFNFDHVLSCILMSEESFLTDNSPLLINVRKEGFRAA